MAFRCADLHGMVLAGMDKEEEGDFHPGVADVRGMLMDAPSRSTKHEKKMDSRNRSRATEQGPSSLSHFTLSLS